jgi:hypothetical protein
MLTRLGDGRRPYVVRGVIQRDQAMEMSWDDSEHLGLGRG